MSDCVFPQTELERLSLETTAEPIMRGGLTKRELFAAMAMQALNSHSQIGHNAPAKIAEMAVEQADLLIEELNKSNHENRPE